MVAEIICVGTELLLGDILNSNAQFLAKELASLGIPHYYQTVVGDNPERIKKVLEIAVGRSQLLIFTGGCPHQTTSRSKPSPIFLGFP